MAGFIAGSLSNSFTLELEAHRALHDELTGLPNRMLLMDRLEHQLYEVRRYGKTFGVLFIDLDGFKSVNDTLGHDVGDAVLRAVARELLATLRAGDTLARLGGDEFVLVCPHGDQPPEELFRERIASPSRASPGRSGSIPCVSAPASERSGARADGDGRSLLKAACASMDRASVLITPRPRAVAD